MFKFMCQLDWATGTRNHTSPSFPNSSLKTSICPTLRGGSKGGKA